MKKYTLAERFAITHENKTACDTIKSFELVHGDISLGEALDFDYTADSAHVLMKSMDANTFAKRSNDMYNDALSIHKELTDKITKAENALRKGDASAEKYLRTQPYGNRCTDINLGID